MTLRRTGEGLTMNTMTDEQRFVPLVLLALELHCDVDRLVRRFAGDIVIDPVSGLRAIPAPICREHLAAVHAQARQIHQDALRVAAERAAAPNPLRERVRARMAAAQAVPDGVSAFEMMIARDPDNPLARAGRNMDDMLRGDVTYHKIGKD